MAPADTGSYIRFLVAVVILGKIRADVVLPAATYPISSDDLGNEVLNPIEPMVAKGSLASKLSNSLIAPP